MKKIILTREFKIPETDKELEKEDILNTHERWLRLLILRNFEPIYLGDTVEVSDRWGGDGKNPYEGKRGNVIGIEHGLQATFNIDYLFYTIKPLNDKIFGSYYYTLDRIAQPYGNELLEKMLKESNSIFEKLP